MMHWRPYLCMPCVPAACQGTGYSDALLMLVHWLQSGQPRGLSLLGHWHIIDARFWSVAWRACLGWGLFHPDQSSPCTACARKVGQAKPQSGMWASAPSIASLLLSRILHIVVHIVHAGQDLAASRPALAPCPQRICHGLVHTQVDEPVFLWYATARHSHQARLPCFTVCLAITLQYQDFVQQVSF